MTMVRFDRVSKQFTLHKQRSRSFQEAFLNVLHLRQAPPREQFWALRDVSFEVHPGEMVGIIGSNGAGKSTVLKLISRIIQPTSGEMSVQGRVGALLELGTGFHPDLTGRENVYLNGSIIGLNKAQVDRILDDIVGFSEMERFIDIPVKHYSSGMYMRLAFSIAIHIHPDILLVDEVLAVGDQAFQLRCLDRIYQVKREGVSIILVTHDLASVSSMCDRAIWLDEGAVVADGPVSSVVGQYTDQVYLEDERSLLASETGRHPSVRQDSGASPASGSGEGGADRDPAASGQAAEAVRPGWRWGTGEARIHHVQLLDGQDQERRVFRTGETLVIRLHFRCQEPLTRPLFGLALHHAGGFHINGPNSSTGGLEIDRIEGEGYLDYRIEHLPLLEGSYLVSVSLYDHEGTHAYDHHHQAYTFHVQPNKLIPEKFGNLLIDSSWMPGPAGMTSRPAPPQESASIPNRGGNDVSHP